MHNQNNLSYLKKSIDPEYEEWQQNNHWGQIVMGPPGSGKTTYCKALVKTLPELSVNSRQVCWINLDPANDIISSPNLDQPDETDILPMIDVTELVDLTDIMESTGLGPNGGLIQCMEIIYENREWLKEKLFEVNSQNENYYFLIDIPGQIELSTNNHGCLKKIINFLTDSKTFDLRLTAVHLIDSINCIEPAKFLSSVMVSLTSMIHCELPHVNVLSKLDLAKALGRQNREKNPEIEDPEYAYLDFNLEYYSKAIDLDILIDDFERQSQNLIKAGSKTIKKQLKLMHKLNQVIEDYSLVRFIPMTIQSMDSIVNVIQACDTANGYFSVEGGALTSAMGLGAGYKDDYIENLENEFLNS